MLQSLRFRVLTGIYIRLRRGFLPSLHTCKTTFAQMQWTQLDACALPEDWERSRGGLQQRFEVRHPQAPPSLAQASSALETCQLLLKGE